MNNIQKVDYFLVFFFGTLILIGLWNICFSSFHYEDKPYRFCINLINAENQASDEAVLNCQTYLNIPTSITK